MFNCFSRTFVLDAFEMFISVFFADRIKDEDQAVRSSNWNLRLIPPKMPGLMKGLLFSTIP